MQSAERAAMLADFGRAFNRSQEQLLARLLDYPPTALAAERFVMAPYFAIAGILAALATNGRSAEAIAERFIDEMPTPADLIYSAIA